MSGSVTEPDITPLVLKLQTQGLTQNQIDDRIIKFFDSYDQSQEKKIEKLNQKLFDFKSKNKRIRNKQAGEHTEKSEYENLFLDCVDECKKEVLRQQIDG
jgi:N-formylglutamate amidohydrolase